MKDPRIEYIDEKIPAGAGLTLEEVKADADIADAISKKHTSGSDNQDLSGLQPKEARKGLSTNDLSNELKENYDAAYTHSQAAHAPSNADNTKEILVSAGQLNSLVSDDIIIVISPANDYAVSYITHQDLVKQLKEYFDTLYDPL